MKPISTLRKPLHSVDIDTKEEDLAAFERSDITAVPAAGVIGEAMLAIVLANAMREKFGGDSMDEMKNFDLAISRQYACIDVAAKEERRGKATICRFSAVYLIRSVIL